MSPDDIFAAQFWPWPDPTIKRDAQGRVLFVNAAFLQLFGGTVQDWTGNVVGGWPAPQGPGQAYRFETRMPMTREMGEQVYDWIEMTLADGNAFTLARNVTVFMQPADPLPSAEMPEQMDIHTNVVAQNQMVDNYAPDSVTAQAGAPVYDTQNTSAPVITEAPAFEQPPYVAPDLELPKLDIPSADHLNMGGQVEQTDVALEPAPQAAQHEPIVFAEYTSEPEVMAHVPVAAIPDPVQQTQTPIAAPQVEASAIPASTIPNEADDTSDRAYERRALPIEESAVLGNNWRDAVIAKAVGADNAPVATEPVAATDESGDMAAKRILLAEDNAINALLTRTLLEAEGHIVETVEDGQLAVEAMKTSTYDLIFMDMRMPNMDGLEATRKIRTLSNVPKNLPIIALTANAFDDDRNACFDSGMNDFMTKPVSAEELSEMVTQWTAPKEERMAS